MNGESMSEQLSPGFFLLAVVFTVIFGASSIMYLINNGLNIIIDQIGFPIISFIMAGVFWLLWYAFASMPWAGYPDRR
jgi:hypothetical protein